MSQILPYAMSQILPYDKPLCRAQRVLKTTGVGDVWYEGYASESIWLLCTLNGDHSFSRENNGHHLSSGRGPVKEE